MKLKIKSLLLALCLLSACKNPTLIEFDVTVPGLTDATFIVKDDAGKSVFGENIIGGKCIVKSALDAEGFYTMDIVKNGDKHQHIPFEIFLEPGTYTITGNANDLSQYPKIVSESKRQQELTDYHALISKYEQSANDEIERINKQLKDQADALSTDAYDAVMLKLNAAQDKKKNGDFAALQQYIKQNPQSEFAAHFMEQQNYQDNPVQYYALYQLMGPTAKNSAEGKMIAERLGPLTKLLPGKPAPAINGKTFDGKTFAQITAGKKLFLIDFWRAGNAFSRSSHTAIAELYKSFANNGLGVISVSIDSKPLWWTTAVKDDRLPWPQMADLKGNDSPNVLNWGISKVPVYFLVDKQWKIIACDVPLINLQLDITQYLQKHR